MGGPGPDAPDATGVPALLVEGLRVELPLPGGRGQAPVVRDVSFAVPDRGFHALVGESGCGKSLTAAALTRLPPADGPGVSGRVLFRGRDLLALSPRALRAARRRGGVAYVFQDPLAALDPVLPVGAQLREAVPGDVPRAERERRVRELLSRVGFADPDRVLRDPPCRLSGGMAQRVCLAAALAQEPSLLVADEPTTALDVLLQRTALETLRDLCRDRNVSTLLVTHNLALVAAYAGTVSVLYAGEVVEDGPVRDVLSRPLHPYTAALLRAVPRLEGSRPEDLATIPGHVPSPDHWGDTSCAFAPRCPHARPACLRRAPSPPLLAAAPARRVRCPFAGPVPASA